MEKWSKLKIDILKWIFTFMVIGVGAYFVLGELCLPVDTLNKDYVCEVYQGEWEVVRQDGTRQPIDLPGKCQAQNNEVVTIETILPDSIEKGNYICYRSSKQDVKCYVDGVLREEYTTRDTRLFGKTSPVTYVFVQVNEKDAGKVLAIETQTDSSFSGIFYEVYYGNRIGIWKNFISKSGGELIFALFTLLIGIVGLLGSAAISFFYHRRSGVEFLSWGVFLAAVWLMTHSDFRQLLFPNVSVVGDMTFFMVMLLPFPFILYINQVQKGRYQKLFIGVMCIEVVNFVLCTTLHVINKVDFADSFTLMAVVSFISIASMIGTILADICKGKIKEYWLVSLGVAGSCLGAVIQILLYFQRTVLFHGVMIVIGLIFLLVVSFFDAIRNILEEEKHTEKVIAAGEAKARFLANLSHEIRTPITAVLGMDVMILRETEDATIREYALDIQSAGQSVLDLMNDVLDVSKIESGKMEIVNGEYDLSSLLHDVITMMSMKAKDRNLDFQVMVDENLPSGLYGDKNRIRQILINIIGNAVKYTNEGGIVVKIDGKRNGNGVLLHFSVKDTGIGIKEEDIEKLFGEFVRLDVRRNKDVEGTGLGLNITYGLLELMGSKLEVESVYGQGSEFYFDLQQEIRKDEPIGNLESRIKKQASQYSHDVQFIAPEAEILVVDDNEVNRKVFIQLLKDAKVVIDEASSGKEALAKTNRKKYDLIFLDHMMPELDGVETLHQMKASENNMCKDTSVIVLTANAVSGAREMYLAEGFDDYLAKPIVPAKLERFLQEFLPEEKIMQIHMPPGAGIKSSKNGENAAQSDLLDEEIFPDVEGLDINYAFLHVPEKKLLKVLLEDFYKGIDSCVDELRKYYWELFDESNEGGDGKESGERSGGNTPLEIFRIKVHGMKSSAFMVGFVGLAGLAQVLEYAARDGKMQLIKDLTPAFLDEWWSYKEKLFEYVDDHDKEKRKIEDPKVILTYLELLKEGMVDMDIDVMDSAMNELKQYAYEECVQKNMDQLEIAVTYLDEERGLPIIEDIKEQMLKME